MHYLGNRLKPAMFDNPKLVDLCELRINQPSDLPFEVDTKLGHYNEAIRRLDIQKAEKAADEILEWLYRYGTKWA